MATVPSIMETNDSHSTDFEQFPQWRELLDLTYAAWRVSDVAVEHTFLKNKIKQFAADILFAYAQLELAQGDAVHTDFARKVRAQIAALSLAQRMSSANNLNFIVLKNKYKKLQGEFMPKKTASEEGPGSTSEDGLPAVALAKNGLPAVALAKVGKELSLTQSFGEHASSHKNTVSRSHLDTHQQRNKPSRQTLLNDRQTKIVNFFQKSKEDKIPLKNITKFFPRLTDRTIRNDLKDLCSKKIVRRSASHGKGSFYYLKR